MPNELRVYDARWRLNNILAITLVLICSCISACGGKTTVSSTNIASVPELLKLLPNLKKCDLDKCNCTLERKTVSNGIPSPSDTQIKLTGSASMSLNGALFLKSSLRWKPVVRADLPKEFLSILPPGDLLESDSLNISFEENATYKHGIVVTRDDGSYKEIFFIVMDLDHKLN